VSSMINLRIVAWLPPYGEEVSPVFNVPRCELRILLNLIGRNVVSLMVFCSNYSVTSGINLYFRAD